MSTTPASAFLSTSNSNAYLPRPRSSAMATDPATRPPAPPKIVPMHTDEDEEKMEASKGR
ncbi:hypothetical protein CVT25_014370 [Psilocybe cyanescens]|uniref:Uncharacterized protein n=1 Tax=Psilocybe cyanescens TaxID=93625 RepID=A0A409XPB9_PSICY|nr:hypothetical protein CVT25_014370 [Psilocybe cyanescens]